VPWVVWDEIVDGVRQVFVARLVGTGATAAFQIVNNGAPISSGSGNATRADITFSGHTPYVTWREPVGGGVEQAFVGHFTDAANPTFVLDESDVPLTPAAQADVREPISSSCTANPFNQDGSACQGNALGTPFFLFTQGTSPRGLFADADAPTSVTTGSATGVSTSGGSLTGSVNPDGASVDVFFQFGTSTAYGQATGTQASGVADTPVAFSAPLTGLSPGTTIHFRIVAVSDFGTFAGADQTFTTTVPTPAPPPPQPPPGPGKVTLGHAKVSGTVVSIKIACAGSSGATCPVSLILSFKETLRGGKVVGTAARKRTTHRVVTVKTSVTLQAGESQTLQVSLGGAARTLLRHRHHLKARLQVTETLATGPATLLSTTVAFKQHGR
jgi:hypothetical protein